MGCVCEACCRDLELKEGYSVHTKDDSVSVGFWMIHKFAIGLLSLILVIGLFGCSIKQQNTALDISTSATVPSTVENTAIAPAADLRPPADGFYLVSNGNLVAIPGLLVDSSLDLASLPSTTENPPTFSVKGDNFPLGVLFLNPYIAGIGVDLKYNDSNATITKVYDNSPAQAAGLQIGDLIISINGVPLKNSLISQMYTPIPNDLLGPMSDRLKLEVITGTNSRILELPRTYTATVHPEWISITFPAINFQVEPKGDYVIIHIPQAMELGAYRFEFVAPYSGTSCGLCLPNTGGIGTFPSPTPPPTPTPTPTSVPISIPEQKWAFILR
jgi:hypothetical protein